MATHDKSHYIELARAKKALHLANHLQRTKVSAVEARYLSEAEKREAEIAAGVHVASEDCWKVVVATMERRERQPVAV